MNINNKNFHAIWVSFKLWEINFKLITELQNKPKCSKILDKELPHLDSQDLKMLHVSV